MHMWRTIAIAVLVLAGCSGQSDGGERIVAESATTTTEQATSTTRQATTTPIEDAESNEERFVAQIQRRLDYDDASLEDTALSMAGHMCSALDIIYNEASEDVSIDDKNELAGLGLDEGMDTSLDDEVTAIIYVIAAEQICPDHAGFVADYLEARGLPHT